VGRGGGDKRGTSNRILSPGKRREIVNLVLRENKGPSCAQPGTGFRKKDPIFWPKKKRK